MRLPRFIRAFFYKPFSCGQCGSTFRNSEEQGEHIWKHALDPGVLD